MSLFTFWLISCLILSSWVCVSSSPSSFIARTCRLSYFSSSTLSAKFSTSTVVAMKFTKNGKLSMERRAVRASFGAKDDDLIMTDALSFNDSASILILSSISGTTSSMYLT